MSFIKWLRRTRTSRKTGFEGGSQTRFHDGLTKAQLVALWREQVELRELDILLHGPLFHNSPVYSQQGQRAYLDSAAAVDSLTGAAAENAGYTLDLSGGNAYLIIRGELEETNNGAGNQNGDLQYDVNGGGYVALTAATTNVRINTGHACTSSDGDAAGNVLTTSGATFNTGGVFDNSAATGNVAFAGLDHAEFAHAVEFVAANLNNADVIKFRFAADTGATPISITISKAVTHSATAAQTVPTPSQSATGGHESQGTAAQTTPTPSQSATGTHTGLAMTGAVAQTVPTPSQAATGSEVLSAAAAQIMPTPLQAATASEIFVATVAQIMSTPFQAIIGGHELQGIVAQVVSTPSQFSVAFMDGAPPFVARLTSNLIYGMNQMLNR